MNKIPTKNNEGARFAPNGRRNNDDGISLCVSTKFNPMARASSGLSSMPIPGPSAFARASVSAGLGKKFQRPMLKNRVISSYNNNNNNNNKDGEQKSSKTSTLGQKRRFDGMSKLMACARKGVGHKKKEQRGDSTSKENQGVEKNTSHTNNDVRVDGAATVSAASSMELEVGSKGSVEKGSVEMEQETGRSSLNREGDSRHSNGAELAAVSQEVVIEQLTHSSPADGKRTSPQQQRDDNDGEDSPPKEVSLTYGRISFVFTLYAFSVSCLIFFIISYLVS